MARRATGDSQPGDQAASRIVSVEARTITIPLEDPTSFSTRQVLARDDVVLGFRLREDALDQYAAGPWA